MQKWIKKGLIFTPKDFSDSYSETHCQMPTPYLLENGVWRIFFAARSKNKSIPGYFDFSLDHLKVLKKSEKKVLDFGQEGYFDHDGLFITSVIKTEEKKSQAFYVGRCNGQGRSFYVAIGTAFSKDNASTFDKLPYPIMQRSAYDPWCAGSCFIIKENNKWRMWYSSGFFLEATEQSVQSKYDVKYAESMNGIDWVREGHVSLAHTHPGESNIARPWILNEDGIYKAWYSYNCDKAGYRIGYAESKDGGYTFERMDHLAGIHPSDEPWENEAVAYPAVIVYNGRKYMFYNGNKFGKDGIALAVEE